MGNHSKAKYFEIDRLDDVTEERDPLDPKWELYSQSVVRNKGNLCLAANEALDRLTDIVPDDMSEVPLKVKGRVKYLLNRAAAETVATRQEVEMFLTRIIRDDPTIRNRSDVRKLQTMEAVKELCKMKGWYSPVEIKNTHEIVVPDAIRRMSDEELERIAGSARTEVVEAECEEMPSLEEHMKDDDNENQQT